MASNELRALALQLAIETCGSSTTSPNIVLATAAAYLAFITNQTPADQAVAAD